MLEGKMNAHLGHEKNSAAGNNTDNSQNGSYSKKIYIYIAIRSLLQSPISQPSDQKTELDELLLDYVEDLARPVI